MELLINVKYMGNQQYRRPVPGTQMNYTSAFITEAKWLCATADEDGGAVSSSSSAEYVKGDGKWHKIWTITVAGILQPFLVRLE